jgi:hypothetical protein
VLFNFNQCLHGYPEGVSLWWYREDFRYKPWKSAPKRRFLRRFRDDHFRPCVYSLRKTSANRLPRFFIPC